MTLQQSGHGAGARSAGVSYLSPKAAAAEIDRRGLGRLSYKTIGRVRLGLED